MLCRCLMMEGKKWQTHMIRGEKWGKGVKSQFDLCGEQSLFDFLESFSQFAVFLNLLCHPLQDTAD